MKRLILTILIIFSLNIIYAQKNNFQEIPLNKLIPNIETEYNIKFFYKEDWIKGIIIDSNYNNSNLDSMLVELFKKTPEIKYYKYNDEYIILSKNEYIDRSDLNNDEDLGLINDIQLNSDRDEIIIHQIGIPGSSGKVFAISGTLYDSSTGEKIVGAEIVADEGAIGTVSDKNGKYKIFLPKGYHVLTYIYMGLEPTLRKVQLHSNGLLDIKLKQRINLIEEVQIQGEGEKKEREVIGFKKLSLIEVSEVPSFMGEVDIIKYSLLLPGIQSAGEMDMSFNVRGGKGDQNLILIDGMHTYSHSHFFGFFPGINPSSVEDASLYKASMPVEFGGRLSSVYDMSIKQGNGKKFEFEAGISPVSFNTSMNIPIVEDKLNINTGYRTTYSDWVLNLVDLDEFERSRASFYDYNIKLNFKPNGKSFYSIFYTNSYDNFNFHDEIEYFFYNQLASINWKYFINDKLYVETVFGYTDYKNKRADNEIAELASIKKHGLTDYKLNSKFSYDYNEKHHFTSGLEIIYHELSPWDLNKYGDESIIVPVNNSSNKAVEASIYLGDKFQLHPKITLDVGVRLSTYANIGEANELIYVNNIISEENITDTISYSNNEIYNTEIGPEYRISASYKLRKNQNLNLGFNRNRQYVNVLTNTQAMTPHSTWQLSNSYIPPQIGDHYSMGYNIDLYENLYSWSIEAYYKKVKNYKDFKNGSDFELNEFAETEIVNSSSRSYGIEFVVKKNRGRMSGWLSYTYSRAFVKSDYSISSDMVNGGNSYPTSFDRPHNLSLIINLEPTRRLVVSSVINYTTGAPTTLPVSRIMINDNYYLVYSDRNEYRLPDYFRWDLSLTYKGNLKKSKLFSGLWTISIYNVLGRNNTYSIYFENNENTVEGYKLSIFGDPIPTITYKFKF